MKALRIIVGLFSTLVIVVAGGGWLWLKSTLPDCEGEIKAPITARVEIYRDELGVATIAAADEPSAFFGLGYAMAQDRLFQMDLLRRAGLGRLSEILGPKTMELDRFFRALGAVQSPEELAEAQPAELKPVTAAFCAGVNHFIATGPLPLECRILGYIPEPWRPADSVALSQVMAWQLNSAWGVDLTAAAIAAKLGPEKVAEFFTDYPADAPTIALGQDFPAQAVADFLDLGWAARAFLGTATAASGSNCFVLAGSRTTTGKPLLANDPHLGFTQPATWWEGTILSENLAVSGVFLPGVPLPQIGCNRSIAWGLTNVMADDADFFREQVNPADPEQYRAGEEWRDFRRVEGRIKVKGQADELLVLRLTRNGVVINDLKGDAKRGVAPPQGEPLALRWVGQDHAAELQTFYGLAKASDWESFTAAVRAYSLPGQNFVYADVDGHIGWRAGLKIPHRVGGYNPILPAEGSSGANRWDGYLPFEAQPWVYDPPEGFIVTANNKSVGPGYPHYISAYWTSPDRARRIRQLIQAREKLSPDDLLAIMADVHSLAAEAVLPELLKAWEGQGQRPDSREAKALEILRAWDREMTPGSAGAALFEAAYARLIHDSAEAALGPELARSYLANHYEADKALRRWLQTDSPLLGAQGKAGALRRALTAGLVDLEKASGQPDPQAWTWGQVHTLSFDHAFKGQSKLLDLVLNLGPYPVGGAMFTVSPTQYRFTEPGRFETKSGASLRFVADLADLERSRRAITTGESGHFISRHYADQVPLWRGARLHAVTLSAGAAQARAKTKLTLLPAEKS